MAEAHPGDSKRIFIIWFTEDLTFVFAILLVYWVSNRDVSFIACARCTLFFAFVTPVLLVVLLFLLNVGDTGIWGMSGDFALLIFNFAAQVIATFGALKGVTFCKARFHQCGGYDTMAVGQHPEYPLHPVAPLGTGGGEPEAIQFPTMSAKDFTEQLNWRSSVARF